MNLKIDVTKKQEGYYVVALSGCIDSDTYLELEKKLDSILQPSTTALILDMGGVVYISSIGFSVIFRAKQTIEKNGGSLAIANLQPNVKKIFDAVKAIPEPFFATLQQADEYLDAYIKTINREDSSPHNAP